MTPDSKLNLESRAVDEDMKTPVVICDPATGETRPFNPEKAEPEKKVPYATQMRIEKVEEEAMYAKRGEVELKNYCRNLEDISKVALEEFNLQFHEYLSLARRRQALDDLRQEKERKMRAKRTKEWINDGMPAKRYDPVKPTAEELSEIDKKIDERLKKKLEDAKTQAAKNKKLEQDLRDRDREIERLNDQLNDRIGQKSPQQRAFEQRVHRKQRRTHGLNHINSIFRLPLLQKAVGKLYEVDKTVSDFLLDIGNAEFVVTKENLISTAARRIMDVRAIDEPEFYVDEKGDLVTRWAYMAGTKKGKLSNLKKAKKGLFDLISNG